MDADWFRQQQGRAGVRGRNIAEKAGGRLNSVSAILTGRQGMTLRWAKAWAEALQVPLELVLEKAGRPELAAKQTFKLRSDALPLSDWPGQIDEAQIRAVAKALADGAGIEIWRVNSPAMRLTGLMTEDFILLDTNITAEHLQPGDVVLAITHGPRGKSAVLRSFEPPLLVGKNLFPALGQAQVIDHDTLTILGKVVASWRAY